MADTREGMDTQELLRLLRQSANIRRELPILEPAFLRRTLAGHIKRLMERAHMSPMEMFRAADIEKSMGYKVLRGRRRPGRNTLIRAGFALGLSLEEVQSLLIVAALPALYPRNRRDAFIIYAIEHGLALDVAQRLLSELGEMGLWTSE